MRTLEYDKLPEAKNIVPVKTNHKMLACILCGHTAELNEQSFKNNNSAVKAVCCTNNGDEDNDVDPCPFYLPPAEFWKPRKIEAVEFWNLMRYEG